MNRTYSGWLWADGADTSFFMSTQGSWWVPSEPDNSQGKQYCVNAWKGHNFLLDDVGCGGAAASCCQLYAPVSASTTASTTAAATATLSPGANASVTSGVTPSPQATSTPSDSAWAQAGQDVDPGQVVGGLFAAIVAAIVIAALVALGIAAFSAAAIWRRRKARRGGSLVSTARFMNSKRSRAGFSAVVIAANPAELASMTADAFPDAPAARTAAAPRFAVKV